MPSATVGKLPMTIGVAAEFTGPRRRAFGSGRAGPRGYPFLSGRNADGDDHLLGGGWRQIGRFGQGRRLLLGRHALDEHRRYRADLLEGFRARGAPGGGAVVEQRRAVRVPRTLGRLDHHRKRVGAEFFVAHGASLASLPIAVRVQSPAIKAEATLPALNVPRTSRACPPAHPPRGG